MGQDRTEAAPDARSPADAQREAAIEAILARIRAGLAAPRKEELPEPAHIYAPEAADDQPAP